VQVISNIDTSSGTGPGGNVTLVASTGAVFAQNITTNGTNTGTAGNITISATTTQVTNFANIDQMVNPVAEEKDKSLTSDLIEDSKTFRDEFADDEKTRLNQEHVLIGSNTQKNFFNLDKGDVVFNPSKDIVVQTHEGEIHIAAGSNVFVMKNGHDVVIYNLHDGKRNTVSIISAKKKLTLEPGRMLVLSRQNTRDFEKITAGFHGIGYRNIKEVDLDSSIKAFYGDFSIPSALTLVVPLKNQRKLSKLLAGSVRKNPGCV
jgi:hypothetical protein